MMSQIRGLELMQWRTHPRGFRESFLRSSWIVES